MRHALSILFGLSFLFGCGDNIRGAEQAESLSIAPSAVTLAVNETATLTATYRDAVGVETPADDVTWISTDPSRATISGSGDTATLTGVSVGSAIITATGGGLTATAQVVVTSSGVELVSIAVTPGTASLAVGRTEALTATGTYDDGSTADLTASATWSSATPASATVAAGTVTALAIGSTEITATVGTISGTATVTVTAAELTAIEVEPATASLAAGLTLPLVATGIYSDGSNADITGEVTWSSSDTGVATIAAGGLATTLVVGVVTITAALDGLEDTAILTVTDVVLVSIDVTAPDPTPAAGTSQQLTAVGTFSDGSTQTLTGVDWTSSNTAAATVTASGMVDALAQGTTTITATDPTTAIAGTATLTVTAAVLVSITVEPSQPSVSRTTTLTFTATGVYSDGSTQALPNVTWASSNLAVATITAAGFTSTPGLGTSTITATDPTTSISGSTVLTVTPATLVRIEVAPFVSTLPRGAFADYVATGIYSDATTQDLTTSVTWSSSDPTVATISNGLATEGLVSTLIAGNTTITAFDAASGLSATASLRVGLSILVSIEILPVDPILAVGSKLQFTAIGYYDDGSTRDLTNFLSWSATAPNVASISTATRKKGLATGKNVGVTTVRATDTASGIVGTTTLTVSNATLSSIVITPTNSTIPARTRQYFTATGVFSDGSMANLTTVVAWSSSDVTVASISNQTYYEGSATAIAAGTTTITATDTATGVTASTSLTVSAATLVSIAITPTAQNLILGLTQQLTATGTFSDGSTHDITREVTWSSTNATIASVSNATPGKGVLSANTVGPVTIAAQFPQTVIVANLSVTVIP